MTEDYRIKAIEDSIGRLEVSVKKLETVVLTGDGPDSPSLTMSLDRLSVQLETAVRTVKAMWLPLLVIAVLLLSNGLFGPSIRRALGLPDAENHVPLLHQQSELQRAGVPYIP